MKKYSFNSHSPRNSSSFIAHLPSPSRFSSSSISPGRGRNVSSTSVMIQTLEHAHSIITKWNPETSTYAKVTSLFYDNRKEANDFIKCVSALQKAMHLLLAENSNSDMLVHAQTLMQIAMKRLEKEFYQILSMNRAQLDPESISTRSSRASTRSSTTNFADESLSSDDDAAGESIKKVEDASEAVMADLRSIAECMISTGYGKECVKIYKIIRKSIVDEAIYRLGVEKQKASQKMDWEVLDLRIKNWLNAVSVSVKTLFHGEKILCDHVFASSASIREACFTEITGEGASILFGFPEIAVRNINSKRLKSVPEKIFRTLDMYTAIANHWPEIESTFGGFESSSSVVSQALNSLIKLSESVKSGINEFELSIQKDTSKTVAASAGVHKLTIDSMNFLALLADYSVVADILFDAPPPEKMSLPESYFDTSDVKVSSSAPAVSLRIAWLILVVLCKLDGKAKHYKDVSHTYLFLANNLQYVISKVRSSNLKFHLGDDWISKHEEKVLQFAGTYERLGWQQVIEAVPPANPRSPTEVRDGFKRFNVVFEEAHRKQSVCVIPDNKLRDEIKVSIARKLLPAYREAYNAHRDGDVTKREKMTDTMRFDPESLGHSLSDLFFGSGRRSMSESTSTSSHTRTSRGR